MQKGDKSILTYENIIILAHAISQGIFSLVILSLYLRAKKQIPGLGYWTLTICLQAIATILLLANGMVSPIIIYGLYALLTFVVGVSFCFGLAEFTQTSIQKRYYYLLFLFLFVLVMVSFPLSWHNSVRDILISIGCVVLSLSYIRLLVGNIHPRTVYRNSFVILILLYVTFGTFHLIRIVLLVAGGGNFSNGLISETPFFLGTQLITFSILLAVNLLILLLVSQKLVQDLSNEAAQNTILLDKLKVLAEEDSLTGLLNRATMEAYLNDLFPLSSYTQQNVLLLFIDVDHFKQVNDQFGHEVGDRVLYQLASLFRSHAQCDDYICRWGGDEFLIILHREADISDKACAEELVQSVWCHDWESVLGIKGLEISISCGYTRIASVESKRDLMRKVDKNLYHAKNKGRNRSEGR